MTSRVAAAGVVTLWLLIALANPAMGHARLISTDPPGGATLDAPPDRVGLVFSEPIEATFAGVQVFGPDRERVDDGEARVQGERVTLPLREGLTSGRYTVVFRIISADGHPVRSQFRFTVAAPAPTETAQPTPSAEPTAPAVEPSPVATPTEDDVGVVELEDAGPGTAVGLWVARFLTYLTLTATVGFLAAVVYLTAGGEQTATLRRRLIRGAAVSAALWTAAALLLFVFSLSSVAARPLPEVLSASLTGRFLQTRFGVTTLLQAGLALLTAVLAAGARGGLLARRGAVATAAAAMFALVWSGHAGTDELPAVSLPSGWVHLVAVTAWVGGLGVLAAVIARARDVNLAAVARRFSRLAGAAIAVVLATGSINALLHLGAVENLYDTTWGRLVVAKVAALAVIGWFGWRNRNVMLPRLASGGTPAASAFVRFALGEVAVMVVAFALAAGLASGIPADAEAASRIQSVASQFAGGQINVTVDPAEVGTNVVHVYFLDANGGQREVADPALTFRGEAGTLEAELFKAGPGHYTVLAQEFQQPGDYEMALSANVDGERVTTTAAITVR